MNKFIIFLGALAFYFSWNASYAQLPPNALEAVMQAVHMQQTSTTTEINGKKYKLTIHLREKMSSAKKLSDSDSRSLLLLDKRIWPYTKPFVLFRSESIDENRDSSQKTYMVYPFIGLVVSRTHYDIHQDYMFKVVAELIKGEI